MSYELSTQDPGHHHLGGELCIYDAAALKPQLLNLLVPNAVRDIDLSRVTEMDSAGVQLMLLTRQVAVKRGCKLTFSGHSPAVREVMNLFHLSADFDSPTLVPVKEFA
ncbi:STAS domain-containing protein [Hydrocarboniclastica marina]|uniref:STAS domain-containing protein n=1 Tax=Hydrocarboniclastica marina TaxID=2259620 RepID=A0A4P7XGK3_9ALTE|nr:STAS domain-containing protein [Hydrocarboniclastica marina]QCF26106.1 STAS domain-containing protein [Hydrocarboniclastica marina]